MALPVLFIRIVGCAPKNRFTSREQAFASLSQPSAQLDLVFGNAVVEASLTIAMAHPLSTIQVRSALSKMWLPLACEGSHYLRFH